MTPSGSERPAREGRRRPMLSFRRRQIPVRALIPNIFTLLGLVAGLTAIRLMIESRYPEAMALIALAAVIDGIDGRLARLLKAQSKFGAELDSLADFVNFGVAPAILIFTWGLSGQRSIGWIVVMVFAVACSLRLARFNAALDIEKPRWQSNYFTGVPAPAGAMTVLLPLYLEGMALPGFEMRAWPVLIMLYTLAIAFLMVSTIPIYSGKLAGEKISRDYVPVIMIGVALLAALLFTYPYITLAICTVLFLCMIPLSRRRYRWHEEQELAEATAQHAVDPSSAQPVVSAGVAAMAPDTPKTRH